LRAYGIGAHEVVGCANREQFGPGTADAQRVEIERYTAHLVRAGVDESRAAHIAYPIMMMLHGVVMHRLLNKKQSPLGQTIAAACLDACMTLLESARRGK
jgi:hypothetical protein